MRYYGFSRRKPWICKVMILLAPMILHGKYYLLFTDFWSIPEKSKPSTWTSQCLSMVIRNPIIFIILLPCVLRNFRNTKIYSLRHLSMQLLQWWIQPRSGLSLISNGLNIRKRQNLRYSKFGTTSTRIGYLRHFQAQSQSIILKAIPMMIVLTTNFSVKLTLTLNIVKHRKFQIKAVNQRT